MISLNKIDLNKNRWERKQDDTALHISHQSSYEAFWEPFYVSIDAITPPHDERFLGYGFTRNGQVKIPITFLDYFSIESSQKYPKY